MRLRVHFEDGVHGVVEHFADGSNRIALGIGHRPAIHFMQVERIAVELWEHAGGQVCRTARNGLGLGFVVHAFQFYHVLVRGVVRPHGIDEVGDQPFTDFNPHGFECLVRVGLIGIDKEDHGPFVPVGLGQFSEDKTVGLVHDARASSVQRKGLTPEVQPFQIFS